MYTDDIYRMCQCPEWGDLHFYDYAGSDKDKLFAYCVNALNGATFISTLGSGNPHKQRLCEAVFAEVFQNILKMKVFHAIFAKFTICS